MKIFNSLTKEKQEFVPIEPGKVKMYACGITCSSDAHIGHAKQAVEFDMIRRYLEYLGYSVTYVRNHTDVDDKIINNANKAGVPALEYANTYIARINEDLAVLGVRPATYEPKASETINDIITFISTLIDHGFAYTSLNNGDVYFDVAKFSQYGKLSHRVIDEQFEGVRVDVLDGKHDSQDFALWKEAKPGEVAWPSPWGMGRPGWHIECSAMCKKYLGDTIDIHGGGRDLKFPHHENEIAQSECANHADLAHYWVHCGLVKVNGVKMSKSLGNGLTIRDALSQYDADTIKLTILKSHYRSDLNIMPDDFKSSAKHVYDFYTLLGKLKAYSGNYSDTATKLVQDFESSMNDDFNASQAIANLFNIMPTLNKALNKQDSSILSGVYDAIKKTYTNVLGLFEHDEAQYIAGVKQAYYAKYNIDTALADKYLAARSAAKANKDYTLADQFKAKIIDMHLGVVDTPNGSYYDIVW